MSLIQKCEYTFHTCENHFWEPTIIQVERRSFGTKFMNYNVFQEWQWHLILRSQLGTLVKRTGDDNDRNSVTL